MTTDAIPQTRILDSLPKNIQAALVTYARQAQLIPQIVIERAIAQFLALDTSLPKDLPRDGHNSADENSLLSELPPLLQNQARHYAREIEVPPEFVIELAIAHFLDPDSVTFDDCQIEIQRTLVEWLKQNANSLGVSAA